MGSSERPEESLRQIQPLDFPAVATRARTTPLGFAPPAFGDEERANVLRSLETGWLTSGPFVAQLEQEFADYCGVEHAFAVSSCTTAMHLALVALGIGAGRRGADDAAHLARHREHDRPGRRRSRSSCDVDPVTLCLDPDEAAAPRDDADPRAACPSTTRGSPCDMDALCAIADEHGLALVEDAAHAVETRADGGRKVGSIGDATCFSFYANKNLAAGEGGMLTPARRRVRRPRALAAAARPRPRRLEALRSARARAATTWSSPATSTTSPTCTPASRSGSCTASRSTTRAAPRRRARYDEGLAGLAGSRRSAPRSARARCTPTTCTWSGSTPSSPAPTATRTPTALAAEGIGTGLHFLAVHELTWYRRRNPDLRLPVAERAAREVLSLPLSPAHSLDDIDDADRRAAQGARARYAGR